MPPPDAQLGGPVFIFVGLPGAGHEAITVKVTIEDDGPAPHPPVPYRYHEYVCPCIRLYVVEVDVRLSFEAVTPVVLSVSRHEYHTGVNVTPEVFFNAAQRNVYVPLAPVKFEFGLNPVGAA